MPATINADRPNMKNILGQEITATTLLIEALVAERKSILDGDTAKLESAVHYKEQTLEQLANIELQRISTMESAGFNPSPDGMVFFLQQDQNKGEVSDLWQQLLKLAADCRARNRQNHQLVEMYSHHTHQALCILRGEDTDQEIYGPGGDTHDHHERRSLAKA